MNKKIVDSLKVGSQVLIELEGDYTHIVIVLSINGNDFTGVCTHSCCKGKEEVIEFAGGNVLF